MVLNTEVLTQREKYMKQPAQKDFHAIWYNISAYNSSECLCSTERATSLLVMLYKIRVNFTRKDVPVFK